MPYRRRIDGCSFVSVWIKTPATERPAVRQSIHVPGRVSSIKTIGVKSWSQRQMDLFNDALRQFIPRVTINHSGIIHLSFRFFFFLLDIVFKNLSVVPQSIDKRVTADVSGVIIASELFPIRGHTQEDSVCTFRHAKKKNRKTTGVSATHGGTACPQTDARSTRCLQICTHLHKSSSLEMCFPRHHCYVQSRGNAGCFSQQSCFSVPSWTQALSRK